MITRRNFIKTAGLATAAALTPMDQVLAMLKKENKLGIQLFSIPKLLSEDFLGGIKLLQSLGYKELELYGPFPFSAESNLKSWAEAGKMLGFSGSGYFGRTAKEVKKVLDDHGLSTPGTHTDLDTLENHMDKLGEASAIMGHQYVTLPAIPDDRRKTLDDYKRMAETFNKIGASAKENGVKFGYHNHGYGIKPWENDIVPLEILLEGTDPDLVFFEMDIFWTTCGGADPIEYLTKYPNRYKMLHLKDMTEKKEFAGDGGGMNEWLGMFPLMASAGDGVLDLVGIVNKAKEVGVEHFFVEQDMVANPEVALDRSAKFLNPKL
ncbi:sugar phosphate isomerase/epimerase family protein [Jiulongibacter sediminis]|nr:sugar phosphate isomerase/epimerase [Jiulongibacter sediminis]TBX21645.1 xylose isomerase [Jiulongibacter sediminis]